MRILVTGGAGFIGSHVSERLLRDRHDVIIVDDMNDYYSPRVKRMNLQQIQKFGTPRYYECDIRDEKIIESVFREGLPEAVIHLAACVGVRPSLDHALLYESVNVAGTMVLLEQSRRNGVSKFLFASSSSIYGIADRIPSSENDSANFPISPYGVTKLAGEKLCFSYSHLYGLSAVCLRLFSVYGPRQRPDLVIHKFTEAIDSGRPILVFGDGSASRDYTFIDDVVEGIISALFYPARYDVFNIGNSSPTSVLSLIRLIEGVLCKQADIKFLEAQAGDVPATFADISKARRMLGYEPRTPITLGIRQFINWYKAAR